MRNIKNVNPDSGKSRKIVERHLPPKRKILHGENHYQEAMEKSCPIRTKVKRWLKRGD